MLCARKVHVAEYRKECRVWYVKPKTGEDDGRVQMMPYKKLSSSENKGGWRSTCNKFKTNVATGFWADSFSSHLYWVESSRVCVWRTKKKLFKEDWTLNQVYCIIYTQFPSFAFYFLSFFLWFLFDLVHVVVYSGGVNRFQVCVCSLHTFRILSQHHPWPFLSGRKLTAILGNRWSTILVYEIDTLLPVV